MSGQIHSTGRGGAGNIGEDPNTYVDGDIIREGVLGVSGREGGGEYSAGRGGAGNMVNPAADPAAGAAGTRAPVVSGDVIPETATRVPAPEYDNYHTGRGGQGNIHREEFGGHSHAQKEVGNGHQHQQHHHHQGTAEGLLEKAKHAIGLDKKKEK